MAPPGGSDGPGATRTSAVIVNPSSLLARCIVAFWALLVEAGAVALLIVVSRSLPRGGAGGRGGPACPQYGQHRSHLSSRRRTTKQKKGIKLCQI